MIKQIHLLDKGVNNVSQWLVITTRWHCKLVSWRRHILIINNLISFWTIAFKCSSIPQVFTHFNNAIIILIHIILWHCQEAFTCKSSEFHQTENLYCVLPNALKVLKANRHQCCILFYKSLKINNNKKKRVHVKQMPLPGKQEVNAYYNTV